MRAASAAAGAADRRDAASMVPPWNVSYRRKSGKHLLILRFSHYDPSETSTAHCGRASDDGSPTLLWNRGFRCFTSSNQTPIIEPNLDDQYCADGYRRRIYTNGRRGHNRCMSI